MIAGCWYGVELMIPPVLGYITLARIHTARMTGDSYLHDVYVGTLFY